MSKICIKCGAELEDDAIFCDDCGVKQVEEEPQVEQVPISKKNDESQVPMSNKKEVNTSSELKQSGFGIASLVCGILSIITMGFLFIPEILGIVFAIIGINDKTKKHGLATAGLITSIVGTVILILIIILAAIGS